LGESLAKGYAASKWMTFKQALELGGHVRKGEHGSRADTPYIQVNATFTKLEDDNVSSQRVQVFDIDNTTREILLRTRSTRASSRNTRLGSCSSSRHR
jgi:antirestriction protein ArdC